MSGNYRKFNTKTTNDTITGESQQNNQTSRAGSANNLFEDVKRMQQRLDTLEKTVNELSKACPHNRGNPPQNNLKGKFRNN